MNGQRLYNLHRAYASDLGIAELEPWDELSWAVKEGWEQRAAELYLRDRKPDNRKGMVSYDGPYSD